MQDQILNMRQLRFTRGLLAAALLLAGCTSAFNPQSVRDFEEGEVARVEPLSWWTGMHTSLQLMVQGPGISDYDVSIEGLPGMGVAEVHKADSPDFLFVDVRVGSRPGTCWIVFSKDGKPAFKYPYLIRERREGSAGRSSFTTEDMV